MSGPRGNNYVNWGRVNSEEIRTRLPGLLPASSPLSNREMPPASFEDTGTATIVGRVMSGATPSELQVREQRALVGCDLCWDPHCPSWAAGKAGGDNAPGGNTSLQCWEGAERVDQPEVMEVCPGVTL